MNQRNEVRKDVEAPRGRHTRPWIGSQPVSDILDVRTVLQEVVENARVLTGARYGVITVFDDESQPEEFVRSGFTEEECLGLPAGSGSWESRGNPREVAESPRLPDLPDRISKLPDTGEHGSNKALLAVPMRQRGVHVGDFFLSEKEGGGDFTDEDQQVLRMLASQAEMAITNARGHRDERRARANLEALVDTALVGLVVCDANSGDVLSANREARRIAGELRNPGCSTEELLKVLTIRRGDGSEISLEKRPLSRRLKADIPLRAEEVVIEAPDGWSVNTLVNATPVRLEGSEAELVVVTLEDMTPFQELDRMRSEFLAIVGHELRAPLLSVKGCTAAMLASRTIPDPAELKQLFRIIDGQVERMGRLIGDLLDATRIEAGTLSVKPEAQTVAALVDEARNTFLTAGGKNPLEIDIPPNTPSVQADRRRIVQVLDNLLDNACRHSPEWAPIWIAATDNGSHVTISVTDEGVGVRAEMLPNLFRKFVRSGGDDRDRGTGGIGLGLAICKGLVEAHGGRIRAESGGSGQGARFTFTLPVADVGRP